MITMVVNQVEAILKHAEPVTLKELNEWYLEKYLVLTKGDKSAPYYGNIILMFEHNEAERVKEERMRKL
jgi:hypothetical protein